MRWQKTVTMVEAHAEGEIGRVVTGGVLAVPGRSMADKLRHVNEVDDRLRRFLVFEPRGCAQMSTIPLFPPTRPDADAACLILQPDRAHAMSGSNSICVTTVLLETGMLDMTEPESIVRLDTPAGLVVARAACDHGKCRRVTLDMPVSHVETLDAELTVPELGRLRLDIAFGGVYYALVDVRQLGLAIAPAAGRDLVAAGLRIAAAARRRFQPRHPEIPALHGLSYVMFTDRAADGSLVGATIMAPGRFDRSPCGTGNAARLAAMAARGQARPGDRITARSIIGSRFEVCHGGETTVAGRPAVKPRITGRGWIHGIHQIGLDPDDPFPLGHAVADCWGPGLADLPGFADPDTAQPTLQPAAQPGTRA